ncbi:MAG TPA: hypothetical protein VKZ59_07875 [Acidobacteriota bacterium]|nr:hypothetical protein [Acidobacteriota bacterium]
MKTFQYLLFWSGLMCLALSPIVRGQLPRSQPFRDWTRSQALTILTDSPWSSQVAFSGPSRWVQNDRENRQEFHRTYTVRLFSALPVRLAFLRLYQLEADYERMSAEERQQFDQRFWGTADAGFDQHIVVSVQVDAASQQEAQEINQFLQYSRLQYLKSQVYLINERRKKIELAGYYPPTPDGTGAKFLFPRRIDGVPSIEPGDRSLQFRLLISPTGDQIVVTWDLLNLQFDDRLEL